MWRARRSPLRLGPGALLRVYVGKAARDPASRATLPNAFRYLVSRGDAGARVLARITRGSY